MKQLGLTDINRILHPKTTECTFFSNISGTITKIDQMYFSATREVSIDLKGFETYKVMFSNHYRIKLELTKNLWWDLQVFGN